MQVFPPFYQTKYIFIKILQLVFEKKKISLSNSFIWMGWMELILASCQPVPAFLSNRLSISFLITFDSKRDVYYNQPSKTSNIQHIYVSIKSNSFEKQHTHINLDLDFGCINRFCLKKKEKS